MGRSHQSVDPNCRRQSRHMRSSPKTLLLPVRGKWVKPSAKVHALSARTISLAETVRKLAKACRNHTYIEQFRAIFWAQVRVLFAQDKP